MIIGAGFEGDRGGGVGGDLGRRLVDEKFVVDPKFHTAVDGNLEGIVAAFDGGKLPGPAGGEVAYDAAGEGFDVGVTNRGDGWAVGAGEVGVIEVDGSEAVARQEAAGFERLDDG